MSSCGAALVRGTRWSWTRVISASSLSESGNPNPPSRETDGNAETRERNTNNLNEGEGPGMCRALLLVGGCRDQVQTAIYLSVVRAHIPEVARPLPVVWGVELVCRGRARGVTRRGPRAAGSAGRGHRGGDDGRTAPGHGLPRAGPRAGWGARAGLTGAHRWRSRDREVRGGRYPGT